MVLEVTFVQVTSFYTYPFVCFILLPYQTESLEHRYDKFVFVGRRETMGINLNFWSFIFSLGCTLLFFLSGTLKNFFDTYLHVHPLTLTLLLSIVCFYLSLMGMKDVRNLTTLLRGILTMVITLILIISISFILFFGHLLS